MESDDDGSVGPSTPSVRQTDNAQPAPPQDRRPPGITAAASEAKFRLAWGLTARLEPLVHLAARLSSGRTRRDRPPKGTIPRRWYISHIFFWVGSGTACWFQFRRKDPASARRHLIRSVWMPPLVWLAALTAIGMAIPDEAVLEMVRTAPYARAP